MPNKGLIRKQVVFNPSDPFHVQLVEHAKRFTNFSSYVRRLIQRDMEGGRPIHAPVSDLPATNTFNAEGWI